MNLKLYGIAILGVLMMAHPHLRVAAGGASVGFPVTFLVVGGILAACLILAVLIARSLLGFSIVSRPHPRTT